MDTGTPFSRIDDAAAIGPVMLSTAERIALTSVSAIYSSPTASARACSSSSRTMSGPFSSAVGSRKPLRASTTPA